MGQCTGSNKRKSSKVDCFWKQPQDASYYEKLYLPELSLHGSLGNFRIKNCSNQKIGIRAEISGTRSLYFEQKRIKGDMSATWDGQQKFSFEKTLYGLKKSFIEIFLSENAQVIGVLKINLFLICDGPFHQDFAVKTNKGNIIRLSFDMKISQIIYVEIQSIEADVELLMERPDQTFNFSIKTIIGKDDTLEVNSRKSYDIKVMLDGDDNSSEDSMQKALRTGKEVVLSSKALNWSNKVCQIMPSIGIKTLASDLHHSYFQILIWKIDDKKIINLGKQKAQLYGECFISLQKIFNCDPFIDLEDPTYNTHEQRFFQTEEKLWHHGRKIGKGKFMFKLRNQKFTKQMHVMVRTEQGIRVYSPELFLNDIRDQSYHCEYLKEIVRTNRQIQKTTHRLKQLKNAESLSTLESRRLRVKLEDNLNDLFKILLTAEEKTQNSYNYGDIEELTQAQNVFIDLGFKMTTYLQEGQNFLQNMCWRVLIALLKRGELTLVYLGFTPQQKVDLINGQKSKQQQIKIQIALRYQKFLYKQLQLALNAFTIRGGVEIERNFSQIFLAYAYFRIPYFREKLFQSIIKEQDPQIEQWRGTEFSLQNNSDSGTPKENLNTFNVLCDWETNFYRCLQREDKAKENFVKLEEILSNKDWKFEMRKRSTGFFDFLIYWVQYVERIARKSENIQWKCFPGYNKLIKCFLIEVKFRPILQYPDALKIACFKLLSNEKLLNSIIIIILEKANIYEPVTVMRAIEFISQIFMVFEKTHKKIPGSFNYYHLYKAIKMILEGDFSFAISKILLMLYNNYKMFHLEFRRNIGMLLLGNVFFRLFLHWSKDVRDIFYHLLVLRIYRESMNIDICLTGDLRGFQEKMNQQIRMRYRKLMENIDKALTIKSIRKKQETVEDHEESLHKTLKNKLIEKKKKRSEANVFDFKKREDQQYEELDSQPLFSQTQLKYQIQDLIYAEQLSNARSYHFKPERSQSDIIKPPLKINAKQILKDAKSKTYYGFKHEIYDLKGGKKMPLPLNTEIVNKYEEEDFQIAQIEDANLSYIKVAVKRFRKVRELLNQHPGDQWEVPPIKLQIRLDIRESRPDKIDNFLSKFQY